MTRRKRVDPYTPRLGDYVNVMNHLTKEFVTRGTVTEDEDGKWYVVTGLGRKVPLDGNPPLYLWPARRPGKRERLLD